MKNIQFKEFRKHSKASERYVDVSFTYDKKTIYTSVPIEYRRTGLDIPGDDIKAINEYLDKIYNELNPKNWNNWKKEQKNFWSKKANAEITKSFFDILAKTFDYTCVNCQLPKNPNWARRIQDLKEFGYTIATELGRHCPNCKKNTTHLILLPIKRGGVTGYESWSPELRDRIITILNSYDVFEAKQIRKEGLLPDHKFSEIRWDEKTRRDSLEELTDSEIQRDFQLMSNQRNQQKREVCRNCYQTGKRGVLYGIPFFYEGTEDWDQSIPKKGKESEKGCIGCAWYDIERWRKALLERLK